jgi:hypothetical protein
LKQPVKDRLNNDRAVSLAVLRNEDELSVVLPDGYEKPSFLGIIYP